MKTYQDLLSKSSDADKMDFVFEAINEHCSSNEYQIAVDAELYLKQKNTTINKYRKLLYDIKGQAIPDNYTANHKCASNFFRRFVTQENLYLLGNGITFDTDATKDRFGGAKFDYQLMSVGKNALVEGVSFGFYDNGNVHVFKLTEFVPLWDEYDGSLKAGIRFWQIDDTKPLRATLYELDGFTDYVKESGVVTVTAPKRSYRQIVLSSPADGEEIYNFTNYPSFPIIPCWGNPMHQSELIGIKEQIDCYDLIKSGFANDLDDASMIYWTLENAGGMGDIDLAKFIERMKTLKAAVVDGDMGAHAEAHTIDVPYQSRETYLTRLENDMYNDYMALNVNQVSAGNITATAINAAYDPMNNKADEFEACIGEFITGLMAVAGVDDTFSFKRSKIANMTEETNMILAAAPYLDDETILRHLPFLSIDEVDGIIKRKAKEELDRYDDIQETEEIQEESTETPEEVIE